MHSLVEFWHCWLYSLVKFLTKSEAVNDLQMWGYSALKVWNGDSKTDALPPLPSPSRLLSLSLMLKLSPLKLWVWPL